MTLIERSLLSYLSASSISSLTFIFLFECFLLFFGNDVNNDTPGICLALSMYSPIIIASST